MKLHGHSRYPVALGIVFVAIGAAWAFIPRLDSPEFLLSAVGAVSALGYFLYSRHLEQAKFFKELFVGFNSRYDALNERLAAALAVPAGEAFGHDHERALIDYFNLCAEEYFFHRAGYIDDAVWTSWVAGMRQYARDARVADLWTRELKTGSYYGFDLNLLT